MAMAKPATGAPVKEPEIQRLVQQIVRLLSPRRVILFGSYAYGEPREESDVDLLVVVDRPPSRREAQAFLEELRRSFPVPLQIVFMSPGEFEETKDVVGGLAYPAHHRGKVLYEQDS